MARRTGADKMRSERRLVAYCWGVFVREKSGIEKLSFFTYTTRAQAQAYAASLRELSWIKGARAIKLKAMPVVTP